VLLAAGARRLVAPVCDREECPDIGVAGLDRPAAVDPDSPGAA
jgi:hypothetical protein